MNNIGYLPLLIS